MTSKAEHRLMARLPKRPDVAVPGRKMMSHEDRQRSMENAF